MVIKRLDTYSDDRFSQAALYQHGCFLADETPYEIEIISDDEAIIRGDHSRLYPEVIDEFRFYSPHITRFFDAHRRMIREFPRTRLLTIRIDQIQPSQFFVDEDKLAAVSTFIRAPQDIIIQVLPFQGRYISLDGHTRLYYAVTKGWDHVRAVTEASDDWVYRFVEEAEKRSIDSPKDMVLLSHTEYEEKWNRFCDDFFTGVDDG